MSDVIQIKTAVFCTFQFEGIHQWNDAPVWCAYLRNYHRHLFHVRVVAAVNHDDRDIEFIDFKNVILNHVKHHTTHEVVMSWSCEQWCHYIMKLNEAIIEVEVSEDNENGAIVTKIL